jgi:ubiquitin-like protein Pup
MMAERVQKQKSNSERVEEEVVSSDASNQQGEKLKAELDDLLDEIDDVLESNAEDFVKSYIQKGGE